MRTTPSDPTRLNKRSQLMQMLYKGINKFTLIPSTGNYNVTISHKHKFMWYRVAKVGTRTILNHLKENHVVLDVEHASWLRYPIKPFEDYFKFSFVRNPWDRLTSCHRDKVIRHNYFKFNKFEHEKMKIFENFVDFVSGLNIEKCDRHLRAQSALIDLNMIDYLGRLETFDDDAGTIFNRLGIPKNAIARKNTTSNDNIYQQYYSTSLAEKVAKIYQKDIQIFGYQF